MTTSLRIRIVLALVAVFAARAGAVNLIVNPDFAHTFPAQRLTWTNQSYVRAEHQRLPGFEGSPFMPRGWAIVPGQDGQGIISTVEDEGRPALRIRAADGERLLVQQAFAEVIPGATYTAGVSIKGSGRVALTLTAEKPAASQRLAQTSLVARATWQTLTAPVTVGPHRHLAKYQLAINGPADLLVRGAELETTGGQPSAAEHVLNESAQPDADTLLLETFDGSTLLLATNANARLTDATGGRFGRGLATTGAEGGARTRLALGAFPPQGTIEFWFKPDAMPAPNKLAPILTLTFQEPGKPGAQVQFDLTFWYAAIQFGVWQSAPSHYDRAHSSVANGWGWWVPGTWHHFAGSWDGEIMRVYVDGTLAGICDWPNRRMPQGQALDLVLPWAGVIDDLRISNTLRYGPVIPEGASAVSFLPPPDPAATAAPAPATPAQEPTEKELDQARAQQIASVPDPSADYIFSAAQAQPAWEGMEGFSIQTNAFGDGAHGALLDPGAEPGRAAFWRLDDIEPGAYYIGLWVESGSARYRTEYWPAHLLTTAYLNGWPIRFATTTDPVQVRPGLWLLELQTAGPVDLKPGDEIAWAVVHPRQKPAAMTLRLALYKKEPGRGHGITGQTFGTDQLVVQRLRLVLQAEIAGPGTDGAEHVARIAVNNPLPYPIDAEVTWNLADYYGAPLTGRTERVRLDAHRATVIEQPFRADGDARAYQLDVRSRPSSGFKFPVPRPRELLELNDWTRMEFLPAQPDSLTAWTHVRKDLVDDRTGGRQMICLDGRDWEWAWLDGRRAPTQVPTNLVFSQVGVPFTASWIKLPPDRFGKWFRKRFQVPEWMHGERFLLELEQAQSEATIFLNGQQVGYGVGSLPIWTDLTAALRPGETNDLLICVRGKISLLKPDFVDQYDPKDWRLRHENEDIYANTYEPPCLKSVYLHALPEVRVKQSLVITDVEQGTVKVMTRLENSGTQPRTVTLRHRVFQEGRPTAVAIPDQKITVTNGVVAETSITAPAGNLTPWTPRQPTLAKLVTTVVEDGRELDHFYHRFGYRSVRVRGTSLLFNGQPVRWFGLCLGFHPRIFFEMDTGADFDRGDSDELRDMYDEIGVPHLAVAWTVSAQNWPRLNNDKYWDSWRAFLAETVWQKGSRPGVVGWQVSCESFHYTIYTAGKEGQAKHGERIFAGVQTIRDGFWPHAWCVADGDETLGGRLDFSSFHYLNHNHAMGGFSYFLEGGFGPREGVSRFPPDGFFLNGADTVPRPGTVLYQNPDWIYGSTACGDTEDFEFWGMHNGVPLSKFIGDRAALSAACQFGEPRGMGWTKWAIEAFRDMDMALAGCVYWQSFLGLIEQDVSFALPQQEIRYYAGAQFDRRLNLHDDEFQPGALDFRWELRNPTGRAVRRGRIKAHSTTAFLQRDRIAFTVPDVRELTSFTLVMELQKDGQRKAYEERTLEVWPRLPQRAAGRQASVPLAVYDPSGTVAPALQRLGIAFMPLAQLDPPSLAAAGQALLIGPEIAASNATAARAALTDWIKAGGRALLLQQDHTELLPSDVTMDKRAWFSQGFLRATNHPALRGLKDMDVQMWNPGHVMARGAFRKPDKGAFMTLVDSGHDGHMAWSELLELYMGSGSLVACQFPLMETFTTEPMAAELLRRLADYLNQPVYCQPTKRLAVLGGASEPVLRRLKDVRTAYDIVPSVPAQPGVLLVDLSPSDSLPDATALRAFTEGGGTLILHRARPEHQAWLEKLLNRPVQISIQPYQAWTDRLALDRRDGLLEGVNNLDLYWRSQLIGESPEHRWQVSCGVAHGLERGQVLYLVRVDGVADEVFPGGLSTVSLGKGRVVIDQLKWEVSPKDMICGSPARVLSMLLTNLGIERRLPAPKPALPPGIVYEPIDISAVANRGFRDDEAGDGIGWLDWGPAADLRSFPTGRVTLAGVPYLVPGGDKNAIVLRMNSLWVKCLADYPDQVAIPVNKTRVAGLMFLHTGGWAAGLEPFGTRTIEYTDGTVEVMQLNAANMADWNPGRPDFPDEEGTLTTVAWQGACEQYPIYRIYHTLWLNPHPEKTIRQVIIGNAGLPPERWRFVAHLGLTAAILPATAPAADAPAPARDTPRSQALLQEALKLLAEKRTAEADAKLEAALQADDRNTAAWMTLANLRAPIADLGAYTALCRRWMAAEPTNHQAHNLLGQFLEQKGKLAEALAEYRESLKLEENQPPIGEAVRRLEKALNP